MAFDINRGAQVVPTGAKSALEPKPRVEPVKRDKPTEEDAIGGWVAASANAHLIFERGVRLRREAEGFIGWCMQMGEPDKAKKWGETQREFAADWRARHRQAAAELKKDIESEWPKNPQRVIEAIFGKQYWRYPYDDGTTAGARKELGI